MFAVLVRYALDFPSCFFLIETRSLPHSLAATLTGLPSMSLIPFTPFLLPTSYFLRPAALAETTPKNVLRFIAGKI